MPVSTDLPPLPQQMAAKAPELNASLASLDEQQKSIEAEAQFLSNLRHIYRFIGQIRKNVNCAALLSGEKSAGDIDHENFLNGYNMATAVTMKNFKEAEELFEQERAKLERYAPVLEATRATMNILMSMRNLNTIKIYPLSVATEDDDGIIGAIYGGKT